MLKKTSLVLMGYMGSGKSTVGKQLSQMLDLSFIDLDDYIVKKIGMPISSIFNKKGEIFFRKEETASLIELLASDDKKIIALGGGTPCFGENMEVISNKSQVTSIYLKLSIERLVQRLQHEVKKRPLISHLKETKDLEDFIRKHLFERSFYYNQSDMAINCDDLNVEEISQEIVAKLF